MGKQFQPIGIHDGFALASVWKAGVRNKLTGSMMTFAGSNPPSPFRTADCSPKEATKRP